ncbi:hypothetical protein GC173_09895 [bacterium]|nr:hypothetical protein [bacterium]
MRRFLLLLATLAITLLTSFGSIAAGQAPEIVPAFEVIGLADRPGLELELLRQAAEARRNIRRRTNSDWVGTATIEWLDEQAFLERTHFRPENTAAAADSAAGVILINAGAWQRSPKDERQKTLTHEVAHLLIGSLPTGRQLPLWANEGLAMHLAGQWSLDDYLAIAQVHATTGLPSLHWLENGFPADTPSRELAYRTSYLSVGAVARMEGDDAGSVRQLVRRLSFPESGISLTRDLRDPNYVKRVEAEVSANIGSRFSAGVIALVGSGFLLLVASLLVIVAFFKVRKRNAERVREEEDEDAWASSLSDEDVQEIYGDREDRWRGDDDR